MNYVNSVLQPGEHVQARSTLHWLVYGRALIALIAAAAFLIASFETTRFGSIFLWIGVVCTTVAVILFVPAWLRRLGTEIAVTDRRIILKRGLIQRHTIEINMDKVESVDIDQSILGRIFDYGTVTIRGTGTGIEPLRNVSAPLVLRNAVTAQPRSR